MAMNSEQLQALKKDAKVTYSRDCDVYFKGSGGIQKNNKSPEM